MKNSITIIILTFCQLCFSQLTQEDIGKFEIEEGVYRLDVLNQILKDGKFVTRKHHRYIATIFEFALESQLVYDTITDKFNNNRKISYLRNENNVLTEMIINDFKDQLVQKTEYQYDIENNLLFETLFDTNEEETQKITYDYDKCKPNYIYDLLDDSNHENPDETFYCITKTTHKKISNYITSVVEVFKIGTGKVKKIILNDDKDSEINKFYTYNYDENGQVIQQNLHRNDKIKVYKTFVYNENGDIIKIKQGYSELYYAYKYDKTKNWIEKTETSKVKSKRKIYTRTIKK